MQPDIDTLADRLAVQDAVVDLLWHVDRRQWQQAKECLADSVRLDYTSLTMTAVWGEGNQHLNTKAAERVGAGT